MTGDAAPVTAEEFRALFEAPPFESVLHGPIAVGVSGGADSTALAYLLGKLGLTKGQVTLLTVDHGLRAEAAEEARQVKALAPRLGFAHETLHWGGDKPTSGIQAAARDARYDLMTGWCREHGVPHLLVAHTLDDQAETFLLRLARGSGVDGLAAMMPVTGVQGVQLVRPLLGVRKARLEATLRAAGFSWVEDPSNRNDQFARVRMRTIMQTLAADGLTAERLASTADRMATAKSALDHFMQELEARAVSINDAGFVTVNLTAFCAAPREIGLRLLAEVCRSVGGNTYRPRFERLQRVYDAILTGTLGNGTTLAGCRFGPVPPALAAEANDSALLVYRELAAAKDEAAPLLPGETAVFDGRFIVSLAEQAQEGAFNVKVLGEEGWQQIKSLIKTTLPYEVCLTVPALWQGGHVIAVPHLGLDEGNAGPPNRFSAVFRRLSGSE